MKFIKNIVVVGTFLLSVPMVFGVKAEAAENYALHSISAYAGDLNYDGKVGLDDVTKSLNIALGIENITDDEKLLTGNSSDKISLENVAGYLKASLGIEQPQKIQAALNITENYSSERKKILNEKAQMFYAVSNNEVLKFDSSEEQEICEGKYRTANAGIIRFKTEDSLTLTQKLKIMEIFDVSEEDLAKYNYYEVFELWSDSLGSNAPDILIKDDAVKGKTLVAQFGTSYFSEEIDYSALKSTKVYLKIPKEQIENTEFEMDVEYGIGYSNPQNINWVLLPGETATDDAVCVVSSASEAKEAVSGMSIETDSVATVLQEQIDKCDFENKDYILVKKSFQAQDCVEMRPERRIEVEGSNGKYYTVGELFEKGYVKKPEDFNAATYLNDSVWLKSTETGNKKVLSLKTRFDVYDDYYYRGTADCGVAFIEVEKGSLADSEIQYSTFAKDYSQFYGD